MSAFGADAVERLDFDFSAFPRGDGQPGNCTGKGYIPEPSEARLMGFQKALMAIGDAEDDESVESALPQVRQALAEFCQGHPTLEEIEQLPPRVLAAFVRWLRDQFGPKA